MRKQYKSSKLKNKKITKKKEKKKKKKNDRGSLKRLRSLLSYF